LYAAGQSSDLSLELLFGLRVGARQGSAVGFDAVGSDTAVEIIFGRVLFAEVGDDATEGSVGVVFSHRGRLLVQVWMVEAHERYRERPLWSVSRDVLSREVL
jgi:hypothetical protein